MEMYELLRNYLEGYVDKCLKELEIIKTDDPKFESKVVRDAINVVKPKSGGSVDPDYSGELTRLMYISKYTYFYGGLYALMYKEILESERFKEYLLDLEKEIRVLSVGCANQIDLWGLLYTCEKLGIKNKIKYVGCEIEENWKKMTIFGQNPKEEGCEFHYGKNAGDIGQFLKNNTDEYDIVFLPSVFNELDADTRLKVMKKLAVSTTFCGITCHSDEEVNGLGIDTIIDSSEMNYTGKKIGNVLENEFGIPEVYCMPECLTQYTEYVTTNSPLTHGRPMENRDPHLSFKILGHDNDAGFALFVNKYLEDMGISKEYHKEIKSRMQERLVSEEYVSKDDKRITEIGIINGMFERKHINNGKESYSIIYSTKGQEILKIMMVDAIVETMQMRK